MLIKLCSIDDFVDQEIIQVALPDKETIAIYQVEGEYYATGDTCSHGKASLSEEGELNGFVITCTWHDGQFDIRTGEALTMPCTKEIPSYPVIVKDGEIWVDIEN